MLIYFVADAISDIDKLTMTSSYSNISGFGNTATTSKGIISAINNFKEFLSYRNYTKFPESPDQNSSSVMLNDCGLNDDDDMELILQQPTMTKEFFCRKDLIYEY